MYGTDARVLPLGRGWKVNNSITSALGGLEKKEKLCSLLRRMLRLLLTRYRSRPHPRDASDASPTRGRIVQLPLHRIPSLSPSIFFPFLVRGAHLLDQLSHLQLEPILPPPSIRSIFFLRPYQSLSLNICSLSSRCLTTSPTSFSTKRRFQCIKEGIVGRNPGVPLNWQQVKFLLF